MNNKALLFFLVTNLLLFTSYSQDVDQSVIATDGGHAVNNQFTVTYTIGEIVTEYYRDSIQNVDLTQGFNQSYISIVSVEDHVFDFEIDVFPNPAIDFLNVSLKSPIDNLEFRLFDLAGKLLKEKEIYQNEFRIGFTEYPAGTYLLVFSNKKTNIKTLKVQKSY
jgi:hypothetical protein